MTEHTPKPWGYTVSDQSKFACVASGDGLKSFIVATVLEAERACRYLNALETALKAAEMATLAR